MESILLFTGIQCGIHTCINRNTVRIHRKTSLPGLESIKKGRKLFAYGSLEPMLISSYYYFFPSYNSNPDYRKTKLDMKKWFSQNVWNCLRAILSTVFMTGFRLVFTISRKRWFFNCTPVQQNWLIRFLWKFFWGYLGHLCIAERSLIEISWKLWSTEFFEKCVRPVFMTFFCKNREGKIVQTWNFVHI